MAKRRRTRGTNGIPNSGVRAAFRRRLLAWYDRNGRDLPWRRTTDPYRVLVSEIMLQQTQVDRVLPKYDEWLARFPSFEALAARPVEEAVKTWYPLGYNVRPRRLHSIARESVARYGGSLPSDEATLLSFKGIGEYTAGAIRSFAFGQRCAILDTNVARVLFRVFVARGDPKRHALRRSLWSLSRALLPHKRVFDFNQALMDFGAMVCTARRPLCPTCPMRTACAHIGQTGASAVARTVSRRASARPARALRAKAGWERERMHTDAPTIVTAAVIERDGRLLVARRLEGSHLAGCWEFPGGKCEAGETPEACLARELLEELGTTSVIGEEIYRTTYTYGKRTLDLRFFRCAIDVEPQPRLGQEIRWVARPDLPRLRFPPADAELVARLAASEA